MSTSLSNVDQIIFDEMVKKAYQSRGFLLRDKVRVRQNVEGTQVSFRKVGFVTAQQYAFQTQVNWQDPDFSPVNLTLYPFRAATLIDDLQQFLFNFDSRAEEASLIGEALGRRSDQLIIDALDASGTANVIAAGSRGLTWDKVREIVYYFDSLAIPPEERTVAISAKAQQQLMASLQFTNSLYTNLDTIRDGNFNGKFAMGMNWVVIPNMDEGGLPITGNIRTCFAFHKQAVGMGIGREFSTIIERVPNLDSWQALGKMFANAIAIDNRGVIEVNVDESVVETSALTVTTLTA
jgi:hypothetical protein